MKIFRIYLCVFLSLLNSPLNSPKNRIVYFLLNNEEVFLLKILPLFWCSYFNWIFLCILTRSVSSSMSDLQILLEKRKIFVVQVLKKRVLKLLAFVANRRAFQLKLNAVVFLRSRFLFGHAHILPIWVHSGILRLLLLAN